MPDEPRQGRSHRGVVSRAGTAYVRTRIASACQVCRARRAKCDNERPCASCRRIGAVCTSEPESSTAGFDPASLAILSALQELSRDLNSVSERVTELRLHGGDIPAASPPRAQLTPGGSLERHLQRGNLDQILAWNIWEPNEISQALEANDPGNGVISPLALGSSADSDVALDFSLFTGYLDAFFRNVHVLNPVLEEERIRGQLNSLLLGGVEWNPSSCLLLLVLANGACSSAFDESLARDHRALQDGPAHASARALFKAAEKRKETLIYGDYLTQARCHFYTGVFLMVSMRPFDAWRSFLHGLATCQKLTGPAYGRTPGDAARVERQAEESIYWSCWKSERELRLELKMPDFTSAHDFPVMFPSLPEVSDPTSLRTWYFYLAEISLWRFEMTARQSMSDCGKRGSADFHTLAGCVVDLNATLDAWQASLPDAIRLNDHVEVDEPDVLLFVLRGRLTYNYEVLTWPFLETLILHGEHSSDLANELAAKGVRAHYDRLYINRPGFYHLHHGTWLMQTSSARSALALLAVARRSHANLLPTDWFTLVSDTVTMLDYWTTLLDTGIIAFLKSLMLDLAGRSVER